MKIAALLKLLQRQKNSYHHRTFASAGFLVVAVSSCLPLCDKNDDNQHDTGNVSDIKSRSQIISSNCMNNFDTVLQFATIRNCLPRILPTLCCHVFNTWNIHGQQLKTIERTYCQEENPKQDSLNDQQQTKQQHVNEDEEDDSFPNLSRHGKNSLLRKILTKSMYNDLKTRSTSFGITIEDLIRAGVCLPYGANPPHNVTTTTVTGLYAGDAESYTVFAPLFDPIIEYHHHATSRVRLQRFRTNLNPGQLIQHRLDPTGEYILYTRMRLARSIIGFRFTPCITRQERRKVERLIRDCVNDLEIKRSDNNNNKYVANSSNTILTSSKDGGYISIMEMSNKQHDDLVRRQLLFTDPDEYMISAGLARDWPDGRGIYCDTWDGTPNLMIWCNAADHIWIISNAKGGDVQSVFTRMSKAVWALETSLKQRGYGFVEDRRLGYLNASPKDIGTALRASVYIKLVRLGQHKGFDRLMKRLHLEARAEQYYQATTEMKRYTGIFDIGNAEALGKTEVQLINIMIHGVAICIDLERRLQNGEVLDLDSMEFPSPTKDSVPPLFSPNGAI